MGSRILEFEEMGDLFGEGALQETHFSDGKVINLIKLAKTHGYELFIIRNTTLKEHLAVAVLLIMLLMNHLFIQRLVAQRKYMQERFAKSRAVISIYESQAAFGRLIHQAGDETQKGGRRGDVIVGADNFFQRLRNS